MQGVLKNFKNHYNAWGNKLMSNPRNWKAILKNHYLLTFDVVVRNNGSTIADVCKTKKGSMVFVITSFITNQNPNQGEATTLYTSIKEAEAQKIKKRLQLGETH